jgi:carbon monoxide dehydrogenase subunit G
MQITQSEVFPYPREEVWAKLMDFEVLGRTLPGIESLDPIDEDKGRLGWVKGDAVFELADRDGQTEVTSTMTVQTGGVLSGVGQRFMGAVANSMIKQFFAAFGEELAAEPVER